MISLVEIMWKTNCLELSWGYSEIQCSKLNWLLAAFNFIFLLTVFMLHNEYFGNPSTKGWASALIEVTLALKEQRGD